MTTPKHGLDLSASQLLADNKGTDSKCDDHDDCSSAIVRPQFFCGQLLTDEDLTSLVDWTRDRLRLARYRHGWGVVTGLEVECVPQTASRVRVTPGYAIDHKGHDILVGAAAEIDLAAACEKELHKGLCGEQGGDKSLDSDLDRPLPIPMPPSGDGQTFAVDLSLHYREIPAEPQSALGSSSCKEIAECEFSRVEESFELAWTPALLRSNPLATNAQRWLEEYRKTLEVLSQIRQAFVDVGGRGNDIRQRLLDWIDLHPPTQFCFIRSLVCNLEASELANEKKLAEVLFWLVQDRRNAFVARTVECVPESAGVLLARVYMSAGAAGGCRVERIDTHQPNRRPLHRDRWPAPSGQVNLAGWLWHQKGDVCTALDDLGVEVRRQVDFELPATLQELEERLDDDPWTPCGKPVCLEVYAPHDKDDLLGERVVGFRCDEVPLGLQVEKTSVQSVARAGEVVIYKFTLHNTGEGALTIELKDSLIGLVTSAIHLIPKATTVVTGAYVVPPDASGTLSNEVVAIGRSDDDREVLATASHSLNVETGELKLTKSANKSAALPGERVTYTFELFNDRSTPVRIKELSDSVLGSISTDFEVSPQEDRTFQRSYVVPTDVGQELTNTATVTGQTSDGQPLSLSVSHTLLIRERVLFTLDKETVETSAIPGQDVTYRFTLENKGNIPVTVDLDDSLLGAVGDAIVLAAGQQQVIDQAYTVPETTGRDLRNLATAVGRSTDGQALTVEAKHTLPIVTDGSIDIAKSCDRDIALPGDIVQYTFDLSNTGRASVSVTATDDLLGEVISNHPLQPGENHQATVDFEVPLDALGRIDNEVTAVAEAASGATFESKDRHSLRVVKEGLTVTKTCDINPARPNENVGYNFKIRNLLDVDVLVDVTDDLLGELATDENIRPGQVYETKRPFVVPADATGTITNTVTAIARGSRDGSQLPGSGSVIAATGYLVPNQPQIQPASLVPQPTSLLMQVIWQGEIGWTRKVPILRDIPQWDQAGGWGPHTLSETYPGTGEFQAVSSFVTGSLLFTWMIRGGELWTKADLVPGGPPPPADLSRPWQLEVGVSFPTSGEVDAMMVYVLGGSVHVQMWSDAQKWTGSLPLSGATRFQEISNWVGPDAVPEYPGSGDVHAHFGVVSGRSFYESVWRDEQEYQRVVPINNSNEVVWLKGRIWTGLDFEIIATDTHDLRIGPEVALRVVKTCDKPIAESGERVGYNFEIFNDGTESLAIWASDNQFGSLLADKLLAGGESLSLDRFLTVPSNPDLKRLENTVTVLGRGARQGSGIPGNEYVLGSTAYFVANRYYQEVWTKNTVWRRSMPVQRGTIYWHAADAWTPEKQNFVTSGELQAVATFVLDNQLHIWVWRANQLLTRTVSIINGQLRYDRQGPWKPAGVADHFPGTSTIDAMAAYVLDNSVRLTFVRGQQIWTRKLAIINKVIRWDRSVWDGPVEVRNLPGGRPLQSYATELIAGRLYESYWRGQIQWQRSIPIINGEPRADRSEPWTNLNIKVTASDSHVLTVNQALRLLKTCSTNIASRGEVVTYTFEVTNLGASPASVYSIEDDWLKTIPITLKKPLESGESFTVSRDFEVPKIAVDPLVNVATVKATSPDRRQLEATASHTLQIRQAPELVLTKQCKQSQAHRGDFVHYIFGMTNNSQETMWIYRLEDSVLGIVPLFNQKAADPSTEIDEFRPLDQLQLDPGETHRLERSYQIPKDAPNPLVNKATVRARAHQREFRASASHSLTVEPAAQVTIDKTCDVNPASPGATVNYTFDVYNGGATELHAQVFDDLLGLIGPIDLKPQQSSTLKTSFEVPKNAKGEIINTASVITNGGDDDVLPGTGELQARATYLGLHRDILQYKGYLRQLLWRGGQQWYRVVPSSGGVIQWHLARPWVNFQKHIVPGPGKVQAASFYILGNRSAFSVWIDNKRWVRLFPLRNELIDATNPVDPWIGAGTLANYPGRGDIQAEATQRVGSFLYQFIWRDNAEWYRKIPLLRASATVEEVEWTKSGAWVGPNPPVVEPNVQRVQAMDAYFMGNKLYLTVWRADRRYVRVVPFINGELQWEATEPIIGPNILASDSHHLAILPALGMTIDKRCSRNSARPGETVTYFIDVKNTSDVALSVRIDDSLLKEFKTITLLPGQAETWRRNYPIPNNSPNTIVNTATAVGHPLVSDAGQVREPVVVKASHNLTVLREFVGLDVKKTARQTVASPGGIVDYIFEITNTGTVELGVSWVDTKLGGGDAEFIMAPGTNRFIEVKYQVPKVGADVLENTVTVTGRANGHPAVTASDSHSMPVKREAGLRLEKTASQAVARPGLPVNYQFKLSNIGDVSLAVDLDDSLMGTLRRRIDLGPGQNVIVRENYLVPIGAKGELVNKATAVATFEGKIIKAEDSHSMLIEDDLDLEVAKGSTKALVGPGGSVTYLYRVSNPGKVELDVLLTDDQIGIISNSIKLPPGSEQTFTQAYVVPLDARDEVVNIATATGTAADGRRIVRKAEWRIPVRPDAGLKVVKTAKEGVAVPGGTVNYSFSVTNTGDIPLAVTWEDSLLGALSSIANLSPGSTFDIPNLSYKIPSTTAEDLSLLTSTVTATGTPAEGEPVTDQVEHTLAFQRTAGLSVVRSIVGTAKRGGTVTYRYSVANTGHLTLTVTLSDSVLGIVGDPFVLAPGGTQQVEKGSDLAAAETDTKVGTVVATGVTADNQVVTDEHTSSVTPATLGLALTKTSIPATAAPNTVVNYLFDITNTGEASLTVGQVVDDKLGVVGNPGRLEPGAKLPMGSFFTVPEETLIGSTINNQVTATGTSDEGVEVTATANHVLQIVSGQPSDSDVILLVPGPDLEPVSDGGDVGLAASSTVAVSDQEEGEVEVADFTEISGIGPVRAKGLTEAGIMTFSDLSDTSVERLRDLFPSVSEDTLSQWKADAAERT